MDNTSDIDRYLAGLPADVRTTLAGLRRTIKGVAPEAVESISYGMPAFKYRGRALVYVGAWKNHCALYGTSEGTMRFPPDVPPSESLVRRLVTERLEAIEMATAKKKLARKS